jgi:hypothetical protein
MTFSNPAIPFVAFLKEDVEWLAENAPLLSAVNRLFVVNSSGDLSYWLHGGVLL